MKLLIMIFFYIYHFTQIKSDVTEQGLNLFPHQSCGPVAAAHQLSLWVTIPYVLCIALAKAMRLVHACGHVAVAS